MGDLVREVKKDVETGWWGMSEEEAAQEGQEWSKVGTKGRYVDIATAFLADVPQDPKDPKIQAKMYKANEVLKKLTSQGGVNHPTFRVVKLEAISQISLHEMRWRIGPIFHEMQASYVGKQMTEQVSPHVFTTVGGGKGIHYAVWDRGQAAGVVNVEAILVTTGLCEELMKVLRDNNKGKFNGRWTGEKPPIRVSQNTRTDTGNIKLEVFSWAIAEEMVKKGLRIGDKIHKVKVWGKPPRKAKLGTGLLPPTHKPPCKQTRGRTAGPHSGGQTNASDEESKDTPWHIAHF